MDFEEEFDAHVLSYLDKAEAEMDGYEFRGLRDLIEQHGAYAIAKDMVDLSRGMKINSGLEKLAECDLLQYSLEQAIIDFADSGKFTKSEVDTARSRLILAKNKAGRRR